MWLSLRFIVCISKLNYTIFVRNCNNTLVFSIFLTFLVISRSVWDMTIFTHSILPVTLSVHFFLVILSKIFQSSRLFFTDSSHFLSMTVLPQILFSSDCVKTASQVNCSCDTDGNPSPAVQWYLNGEPVNQSGGFEIFSETLNITVHRSSFILSQPHVKHFSTLLCRSFNSLGSASQQFCMSKFKSSAEPQGLYLVQL